MSPESVMTCIVNSSCRSALMAEPLEDVVVQRRIREMVSGSLECPYIRTELTDITHLRLLAWLACRGVLGIHWVLAGLSLHPREDFRPLILQVSSHWQPCIAASSLALVLPLLGKDV